MKIWQLFSSEVSKNTSVKYPWNDAFSGITKIDFYPYCLIIVVVLTKCSLYCIYMIFWSFMETMTYTKNNFCFHESIFQWEIKLISHQSEVLHLTVGVTHPVNFFLLLRFFDKMMLSYVGKWLVTIIGTRHDLII